MSTCYLPAQESPCRHCSQLRTLHRRGLCRSCYARPEIRVLYPRLKADQDKGGMPDLTGGRPHPAEPTDALPGSPEKVDVLAERASRGEVLWHPDDARPDAGELPSGFEAKDVRLMRAA